MTLRGDEGDRAAAIQQMDIDRGLTIRKAEGPQATGACLFCGEIVGPGQRWCNSECRDDWQADRAAGR